MKKIILILGIGLSSLFGNSSASFVDLYGEVQMNNLIADDCLKEIAFTRKTNGNKCIYYYKTVKNTSDIYGRLINRKFSDFNTENTYWNENDWILLQNQMKRIIYTNDLLKQFNKW